MLWPELALNRQIQDKRVKIIEVFHPENYLLQNTQKNRLIKHHIAKQVIDWWVF